ncbi:STAS domain-containing protein [Luteimonas yindakuii]|uniref:STAS domain-containing protein n=1 Tax=Luteimonas yindakuii TaxID=2565782 RepID=UPI001FB69837|nr:STAS domain-containing protein [Luteimonas yindakuii]
MTLQSDLGIESSAGLKDMLATHVAVDAPLAVDGAGVQRVHTASLQVLAAWWQARTLHARETRWAEIGEPLRAAVRTLGLDSALAITDAPAHPTSPMERTP